MENSWRYLGGLSFALFESLESTVSLDKANMILEYPLSKYGVVKSSEILDVLSNTELLQNIVDK